jgi:hypothetical protein
VTPLDKLEAFVIENYSCAIAWEEGTLRDWLLWAFDRQFLFLVIGRGGCPEGMAIARPLDGYTDSRTEYHPHGSNIYIDLTIAKRKAAMKPLMAQIVNKFGVRKKIVFKRYGRSEAPRFYDFRRFSLKILTS